MGKKHATKVETEGGAAMVSSEEPEVFEGAGHEQVADTPESGQPVASSAGEEPIPQAGIPAPINYVVGMICRVNGPHDVDGTAYKTGAEITLPPTLASIHAASGAITILKPIEETINE